MQFGVTYYPDQWPKERWDDAFREIKQTGFHVVRFAEMAWDWIEPREGEWSFEELDHAMALCEKHHLKVVLGVPVAQAPQWLVKKYPDMAHIANDGYVHPAYGPRPNACRDNINYKQYAETLARVMAQRYSNHPALLMWQVDNEPGYPPLDLTHNKDYCHCEATRKAFVEWAKNKYGTIEKLNDAWGTRFWTGTFSSFDEVSTPKAGMWDAGNPHIYLDWYRFKSENLSKWLNRLKHIIRESDKVHKIGTNSFTSIINRIADHAVISEGMDWFGWDIYPKGTSNSPESFAQIADYWRSVCEKAGADFVVSELQGGPNVRWGSGEWVTGKEIKEWVRLLNDHGAKMILFHNWLPPLFGSETGGFGIMRPDGRPTERHRAIKEIVAEINKKPAAKKNRSSVGIFYSRMSDIQTFQEEGTPRPAPPNWFSGRGDLGLFFSNNSIAGAYRLCHGLDIKPRFIFDADLEEGAPECKTLLLPNPYLLSDRQFDNVLEFVKNGGLLATDSRFGLKDEMARLRESPLVEKLIGAEHLYTEISGSGFRDIMVIKDKKCRVLKKFDDGYPSLIESRLGKGYIIYAAFSLFSGILKGEHKAIASSLRKALKK